MDIILTQNEETCCQTVEDGVMVCSLSAEGKSCCGRAIPDTFWQKMRGGVMVVVACFTSPCCTPLFVPLFLSAAAGTPLALWMGQNLGWVYGGLTLISVVSLVMSVRHWRS